VTDTPLLTVVVPTHDRREAVLRLLDALAHQDVPPSTFQVVVAIDGSTDGTAQALRQRVDPFGLIVLDRPSQGPAAARNEGARHAAGRILLFLDDDVRPDAHLVSAHLALHAESTEAIGIGLLTPVVDTDSLFGKILRYWWTMMQESILSRGHRFSFKDLLSGHFSIARTRFDDLGGFDSNLRCHEDYEFGFRGLQAGMDFRYVAGTDAFHHDDTTIEKALRRKVEEGMADVALGRRHPALVNGLPFAWQGRTSRKERVFRKIAWFAPRTGDLLARTLLHSLAVFEAASLRFRWRAVLELLLDYWYWRGVATVLHHPDNLRALLATAAPDPAPMTVDLASGFAAAEAVLDEHRPAAAHLVIGKDLVATVPAYAGYERLRGAHLRPLLARWCDLSYLSVAERHGRMPETLVLLARRFEGVPRREDE